ncbi:MAG TPA: tRNA lysidine(34) synthetase TilS [Caulobacteraceae bacterium]
MPCESEVSEGLNNHVHAILDRRLSRDVSAPIAVALSGGGDSLALLTLAADWAKTRGRKLIALTVDHRVQADSARWSAFARDAALRVGAEWRGLVWEGEKPATGLQAAARGARHALIAEAARDAGGCVVLFGHTRDDVLEADRMRAEGSTLGHVREWSPSPAWPQGRDVFLLRPLLDVSRAALRAHLTSRGLDWIDDPANADLRYARSRARAALQTTDAVDLGHEPDAAVTRAAQAARVDAAGVISWPRPKPAPRAFLAAALLCASGGERPPRGDQLERLAGRLDGGGAFTATLRGARIEADAAEVRVVRDAGETARGGLAPLRLTPGQASIWDGRFEITADGGGEIRPLKGLAAALSHPERQEILGFSPQARPGLPVLIAQPGASPVLAAKAAWVRVLAGPRLGAACGLVAQEADIAVMSRGADGGASLC